MTQPSLPSLQPGSSAQPVHSSDQGSPASEPQTPEEAEAYVGREVLTDFAGVNFRGKCVSVSTSELPFWYRVLYEDGDQVDYEFYRSDTDPVGLANILLPLKKPKVKREPMLASDGRRKQARLRLPVADENQAMVKTEEEPAAGSLEKRGEGASQQQAPAKRQRSHAQQQAATEGALQPRQNNARAAQAPAPRAPPRANMAAGSSQSGGQRTQGLAGHLANIWLENFMCHELFEMEFGPHVTLVSGTNGSGKSAVMQALQTCLGVNARDTGRAKRLPEFIRKGCHEARMRVTLYNTGTDAFEPEKFGDRIIIERRVTVSAGGSYWKALNANGKVVSEHKPAEVLSYLGVNAANPLTIITQDMARAFLSGSSGDKKRKYDMFMEGTQLDEIRDELASSATHVASALARVKAIRQEYEAKQKEVEEVQANLEKLDAVEKQKEMQDVMTRAILWQFVAEHKEVVATAQESAQAGPRQQAELEQHIDRTTAALQQVEEQERTLTATIAECQEAQRNAMADLQHLKDKYKAARNDIRSIKQRRDAAERTQRDLALRKGEAEKVLNEDQSEKAQQRREAMEQLEQEAAVKRQALQEADDALAANRINSSALQSQLEDLKKAQGRLRSEAQSHAQQVRDMHQDIQQLEATRLNSITRFGGEQVVRLLRAVQQHQSRFRRQPIGPVGALLGLKESRWATAIQAAMGAGFNNFLCHCMEDVSLLRELARGAGYNMQSFNVIKYNFDLPQHNVPVREYAPGVRSVQSVLSVSDASNQAVLWNYLVDSFHIESTVLADSLDLARDQVYSKVVNTAFCQDGTKIFKAGLTVSTHLYNGRPGVLGVDDGQMKQQLQDAMAKSQEAANAVHAQAEAMSAEVKRLETDFRELQRQQTELGKRKKAAKQALDTQQRNLQDQQQQAGPDDLDDLATQVATYQTDIMATQAQLADADEQLQAAEQEERTARELFEQRKSLSDRQPDENAANAGKLDALGKQKAALLRRLQTAKDKLAQVQAESLKTQQSLQDLETEVAQMREDAEKACSEEQGTAARQQVMAYLEESTRKKVRLDTRATSGMSEEQVEALVAQRTQLRTSTAGLDHELKKLNAAIAAAEGALGGNREELQHQYNKLQKQAVKLKVSRDASRSIVKALHTALNERQTKYEDLKESVVSTASEAFHKFMCRRKHLARLLVDDTQQELILEVQVKGAMDKTAVPIRDLKQLSGGERSYTTVSFLLALGQHTEAPFRCMDEFDVFMDNVNRRVATETLLEAALGDLTHQYILLTPQDIQAVEAAKETLKAKKEWPEGFDDSFLRVVVMRPARP